MALWGGRFSRSTADDVFALSRSIHFDWKLAPYDIRSSLAHLYVLESAALISESNAKKIRLALKELSQEVASGSFLPLPEDEDVLKAIPIDEPVIKPLESQEILRAEPVDEALMVDDDDVVE